MLGGGAVGNILSVAYGNLMLLASSCAITMVFNLILAVTVLHEAFSKWDALAILLVSAGSISCMLLSKQEDGDLTTEMI